MQYALKGKTRKEKTKKSLPFPYSSTTNLQTYNGYQLMAYLQLNPFQKGKKKLIA